MASMNRYAKRLVFFLGAILAMTLATGAFRAIGGGAGGAGADPCDVRWHVKADPAAHQGAHAAGWHQGAYADGKAAQMTFEAFAERVGKPGKTQIEERIHDPLVRIDSDLAVVWVPFDLLVDGKVDHYGTDMFDMVRVDGKGLSQALPRPERRHALRNKGLAK
jgi:hypothetical protein